MVKYFIGNNSNWSSNSSWSTSSGGPSNSYVPTANDDVFFDVNSPGNCTIDINASCQSINCTGYIYTLTHNSGITLSIGGSNTSSLNVALKFVSGMTYTLGNVVTSAIAFISTATTQQTIDPGGKTLGNVIINGSGSNYAFISGVTLGTTATLTLTTGTLHTDGTSDNSGLSHSWGSFFSSYSNTRSLVLGTSTINLTQASATVWNIGTVTGITLSAASSTISCSVASPTFTGGLNLTYGTVNFTGSGTVVLSSSCNYGTLNRTGTAVKTDSLQINANFTVTSTLLLAGNSATNRLLIQSNTVGNQVTITNTGATMTWSNVDFMDIALSTSYDAHAITGNSGDCGGNSNIMFTTSAQQTWSGTSGGNWSANAWTSRVPLPQDDVVIGAISNGQTITIDMPRIGRNINLSALSNISQTVIVGTNISIFGSLSLSSTMTWSGGSTTTFSGRSNYVITSAGQAFQGNITISAPNGIYSLNGPLSGGALNLLTINAGSFITNNFNIIIGVVATNNSITRSVILGISTISLTQTGSGTTPWSFASTTGLTFSGYSSTIIFSVTNTNSRTFAGGGLQYGTLSYSISGSTGTLVITGSNTFNTINVSDASNARTLQFTAGTTTTIQNSFNVNGTAGNPITIQSTTPGSIYTLSKSSSIVKCNYLAIQDCVATGGASWYAGANSYGVIFDGATNYVSLGTMGNFGSNLGSGFYCSFQIQTTQSTVGWFGYNQNPKVLLLFSNSGTGILEMLLTDNTGLTLRGKTTTNTNYYNGNVHTVVMAANYATNTITISVDGTPYTISYSNQQTPATFVNFNKNFFIGAVSTSNTPSEFLACTLDNFQIGTSSIQSYGIYSFNGNLNDQSGNNNTGTAASTGALLPTASWNDTGWIFVTGPSTNRVYFVGSSKQQPIGVTNITQF